jgi:hypothetical protein
MVTNKINDLTNKHTEIQSVLQDWNFDDIEDYIDNNITNLLTAKTFLKKLSKVVLYYVKRIDA